MTHAPPANSPRPHAFILAGGEAKRMGGADKARLLLRGEPLLLHVARALAPVVASITVIGRAADAYADLGLKTLADITPGAGPLSGLHRALTAMTAMTAMTLQPPSEPSSGDLALLTACDLDGLQGAWIDRLVGAATPSALAVAFCDMPQAPSDPARPHNPHSPHSPRNPRGWEPLPALYSGRLLPEVCARLARGEGALWRLLDAACATPTPRPHDWAQLRVINTPQDLARAQTPRPIPGSP